MEKKQSKYDIAFVADGNASIGMGHIMRCSAIADALRDMGFNVLFITSDMESYSKIIKIGFDAYCLEKNYRTLADQDKVIVECLMKHSIRFVFFDSYYASNALFEKISAVCHVGCFGYGNNYFRGMDLIVPYGISSNKQWLEDNIDHTKTKILFGSKFVPLKKSFWNVPPRDIIEKPKRLLLTSGGTDPLGITTSLIKEIDYRGINIAIDVVVGQFYDDDKSFLYLENLGNITFHKGLNDLSELMLKADIAISAGGMTLYELMASYVPTIAYAFSDNQLGNSKLDGYVVWCGDIRTNNILDYSIIKKIVLELESSINNKEIRSALVKKGRSICDGQGAIRIANEIAKIIHN